jgi:7-keto-8-aminopelargonate synthetase-like enzyme
LFVDDAHGFGTMVKTVAGAHEEQGAMDGVDNLYSARLQNRWQALADLFQAQLRLLNIFALQYAFADFC